MDKPRVGERAIVNEPYRATMGGEIQTVMRRGVVALTGGHTCRKGGDPSPPKAYLFLPENEISAPYWVHSDMVERIPD